MVPVYAAISGHSHGAVRLAIALMAAADALAAALLAFLATAHWGRTAGIVAGLLWAVSPLAAANALGGLETSLAVAAGLALAAAMRVHRGRPGPLRAALCGAAGGVALLARVDLVFLAAGAGALALARRWSRREIAAALAAAALVLAPWWLYQAARFGTVVPTSGAAVKEQVKLHRATYLTGAVAAAWAGGYLVTAPFADWRAARQAFFEHPEAPSWVALALAAVALAALLRRARRARSLDEAGLYWAFGIAVTAFYVAYLPALWFFRRYLAPAEAAVTLFWAAVLGRAIDARRPWPRALAGVALAAAAAISVAQQAAWLSPAAMGQDDWLHGAKGYRDAALTLLPRLPDGAVLGAFQSGALAYYAAALRHGTVRVVNLDGVVDRSAFVATRNRTLSDYARETGMTYFADWAFNVEAFRTFSDRARAPFPALTPVADGPLRGIDHTVLYRIEWGPGGDATARASPSGAPEDRKARDGVDGRRRTATGSY
jgi:hypothetical protein